MNFVKHLPFYHACIPKTDVLIEQEGQLYVASQWGVFTTLVTPYR